MRLGSAELNGLPLDYDFFSSSFLSSSRIEDLKLRMPSPRLFPSAANLLGPKINSTMARMKRISVRPILPSMMNPPQNCKSFALKSADFPCASEGEGETPALQRLTKILGYLCGGVKECASYR